MPTRTAFANPFKSVSLEDAIQKGLLINKALKSSGFLDKAYMPNAAPA